jgi:hypothetical protein
MELPNAIKDPLVGEESCDSVALDRFFVLALFLNPSIQRHQHFVAAAA